MMPKSFREQILLMVTLVGVELVIITEGLSFFHSLGRPQIYLCWFLCIVGNGFLWKKYIYSSEKIDFANLRPNLLYLSILLIVLLLTALTAWFSPPNNYDSMTYHMSRVMHWIQNKSVAHYACSNLRQLQHCPWAEYGILHLQLIIGNDRLANFIQWFSFLGVLMTVTLITRELGVPLRGQIGAATLTAVLPTAILQSSSTQNDLAVSFWISAFVFFILRFRKSDSFVYWTGAACCMALAFLTKIVSYIFCLPFLLWFFFILIRKKNHC